ncbi:hypothetical protein K32_49860 [Kaistia sp. 32K]|uniref:hypothetical protein n=1 Tax=Kaistia sp. 32K TaxID=2795690 RepID=UPI0019150BAE|nr:hypothetical protein [Kaistia sp. 32K]BCP56369.1 hypothetical protein K32_49860 [Kaistia sp. 32K]
MSDGHFHTIEASGVRATLDLRGGHVRVFATEQDGRRIEPLHTAPWVDDRTIVEDETIDANLRFLSGDFFCAPFSTSDVEEAPPHGWPANSPWTLLDVEPFAGGQTARYELVKRVLGARLVKEFTVRDGHPFLYERHVFIGGEGHIPVANHAMTRFDGGGRLSFSPKRFATTPEGAIESDPARGRSLLAYPSRFTDLTKAPRADGTTADLTVYPFGSRHEDFLSLVEVPENPLGWAAAIRPDKRDIFLSLKNPADYPITMMWFSNGGRDYQPWNGRHVGVLGLEEGRSYAGHGHKASIAPNPWSDEGIPTSLHLDPTGEVDVRNVIGGLALPEGWTRVASVEARGSELVLVDEAGGSVTVPYDAAFLTRA